MVRLKALQYAVVFVYRRTVSIPYGSIKSSHLRSSHNRDVVFQFLMVRLKVAGDDLPFVLAEVSIPYGSIKRRVTDDSSVHIEALFQFLMVRLKGIPAGI